SAKPTNSQGGRVVDVRRAADGPASHRWWRVPTRAAGVVSSRRSKPRAAAQRAGAAGDALLPLRQGVRPRRNLRRPDRHFPVAAPGAVAALHLSRLLRRQLQIGQRLRRQLLRVLVLAHDGSLRIAETRDLHPQDAPRPPRLPRAPRVYAHAGEGVLSDAGKADKKGCPHKKHHRNYPTLPTRARLPSPPSPAP